LLYISSALEKAFQKPIRDGKKIFFSALISRFQADQLPPNENFKRFHFDTPKVDRSESIYAISLRFTLHFFFGEIQSNVSGSHSGSQRPAATSANLIESGESQININ
jgi:hypothetical protein